MYAECDKSGKFLYLLELSIAFAQVSHILRYTSPVIGDLRDLISICICSEYFTDYEDDNVGIEPAFSEVIAIIEKDCAVTASAIFGGIDIYVPDNVNVKISSNSIFGGVSEKKHRPYVENAVTVYINATCIFGGVEIK